MLFYTEPAFSSVCTPSFPKPLVDEMHQKMYLYAGAAAY